MLLYLNGKIETIRTQILDVVGIIEKGTRTNLAIPNPPVVSFFDVVQCVATKLFWLKSS